MAITLDGNNTATVGVINSATAQNSTSGTAINFTGIPSGVKRITVMFNGISKSGTANFLVQIGSGSIASSGYASFSGYCGGTNLAGSLQSSAGFPTSGDNAAAAVVSGSCVITNISGNIWVATLCGARTDSATGYSFSGGGNITLSGALDRVRITTTNGTDTFDAGSINILYE